MDGITRELGAIAYYCAEVFESLGKAYYKDYRPLQMMCKTDVFYNFVEDAWLGSRVRSSLLSIRRMRPTSDIVSKPPFSTCYRVTGSVRELKNYYVESHDPDSRIRPITVQERIFGFKKNRIHTNKVY